MESGALGGKWVRKTIDWIETQICNIPEHFPSLDQLKYFDQDLKAESTQLRYNIKYGDNI